MSIIDLSNKVMLVIQSVLVILPSYGYIFPDEFFQSPEVMAGDIFNYNTTQTWEWNPDYPARSIMFPFFSSGIPFIILKEACKYVGFNMTSEILLVAPRISMFVATLLIDLLLQRIYSYLRISEIQHSLGVFLFRTSFVTLLFLPRTFSNTYETLIYAVIILISIRMSIAVKKISYQDSFHLGFFIGIGFFIRQTMLAYSVVPALFIVYEEFMNLSGSRFIVKFIKSRIISCIGLFISSLLCIVSDKYYFQLKDRWEITPWNLILYNLNPAMVEKHGKHPRYLNFTVNMVLLFGPAYILFIYLAFKKCNWRNTANENSFSKGDLSKYFIVLTIIPVALLSLIPHQEPRYIIPIIIPLLSVLTLIASSDSLKKLLLPWLIFNLIGFSWFGLFHQGGVIPALSYLNRQIRAEKSNQNTHIIFWQTYMPPRHLLAVEKSTEDVFLYDLMGMSEKEFCSKISAIEKQFVQDEHSRIGIPKVILVLPSTLKHVITDLNTEWILEREFFPHLSMENPPNLQQLLHKISKFESFLNIFNASKKSLSLNLYTRKID